MASKILGYAVAAVTIIAGIITLNPFLIAAGALSALGTALTPSPPRPKQLRDSPTYGIDVFENPRGPEKLAPIIYGNPRVKPVVIAESVREAVEGGPGNSSPIRVQEFKWLGAVGEGEIAEITDIEINDREVFGPLQEVTLGKGNGTRRIYVFPHRWVVLGDDEIPGVEVSVDGAKITPESKTGEVEFLVPAPPPQRFHPFTGLPLPPPQLRFHVILDDRRERILDGTLRVFIRGPSVPEFEQLRRVGRYRWSGQRLAQHRARVMFGVRSRVPEGYTVRITYEYLASGGVEILQAPNGVTQLVFGTAPDSGDEITATYRTTAFGRLRVTMRRGTIDQSPIEGFADLEQSRNPTESALKRNVPLQYSTSDREVDNARIGLSAPGGLIEYSAKDGGTSPVVVFIRIEYRVQGETSWTTLLAGDGAQRFKFVGEKAATIRWEIDLREELRGRVIEGVAGAADALAGLERSALEFQLTRLTALSTDPLVTDEIVWSYVTEVLYEGYSYPGTSLLGLQGSPGAFLSNGSLRVSCRAQRADLYDPRTGDHSGARELGRSSNHALAIRDLITSSEGDATERFGGGSFFTGADLFLGTDADPAELNGLIAFADHCDAWVHRPGDDATKPAAEGNGERRCRLDIALDTPQSLMETVGDLAFLGYCFATLQGALWRFPLDQDGDAVFTFVDEVDPRNANMSEFTLRLDKWAKSATGVQGSFWNEDLDFERDELLQPIEDLPEGTPINIRDVDLRGTARETEAARMLRHLAEQAKAAPWACTWVAHPGSMLVEAGDIVTCKTRVPYSTGSQATELKVRVLAGAHGRDDEGRIVARYAGRVMASKGYTLSNAAIPTKARLPGDRRPLARRKRRRVTGLRARVRARSR